MTNRDLFPLFSSFFKAPKFNFDFFFWIWILLLFFWRTPLLRHAMPRPLPHRQYRRVSLRHFKFEIKSMGGSVGDSVTTLLRNITHLERHNLNTANQPIKRLETTRTVVPGKAINKTVFAPNKPLCLLPLRLISGPMRRKL